MRLLLATKDYSKAISESGYILKEDEDNLEALLLRGRAYYYLADHDVATRSIQNLVNYIPYSSIPRSDAINLCNNNLQHLRNNFMCFYILSSFYPRHYQKGLRLDPEHGELKKAYFGLKNLLKKTKSVMACSFLLRC